MRLAYFDLISGASGDMILGALVDAGLAFDDLQAALGKLQLPGYELLHSRVQRGAFAATKIDVQMREAPPARHWHEIQALVNAGDLPEGVRARALRIFRRMIEVEAGIHGLAPDEVHLHELGAVDTIVDVVGALLGLELLGVEAVIVSPVPLGRGMASGAHGRFPLPAPATLALLRGAPIVGVEHAVETVTPTAAALLVEIADGYGPIPAMQLGSVGYGAGTRFEPEPNLLRLLLGEAAGPSAGKVGTLELLETNIDDMNPEIYGYVLEKAMAAGALDVYLTPVVMKKNRPGVLLSVLCRPDHTPALRALLFAETSTLGIRTQQVTRHALSRASETVDTPYGPIGVKIGRWGDGAAKAAPEYEDCARAAREHHVPLREVYAAAASAWAASQSHATDTVKSDNPSSPNPG